MSMISGLDYADCFPCSGTEEEEQLLAAHLGIFDSHVQVFEERKYQLGYEAFCAEIEGSEAYYATADAEEF